MKRRRGVNSLSVPRCSLEYLACKALVSAEPQLLFEPGLLSSGLNIAYSKAEHPDTARRPVPGLLYRSTSLSVGFSSQIITLTPKSVSRSLFLRGSCHLAACWPSAHPWGDFCCGSRINAEPRQRGGAGARQRDAGH